MAPILVQQASHLQVLTCHGDRLCPGCFISDPVPCYGLGNQQKMVKVLETLQACGKPRSSSFYVFASDQLHSGHVYHLESKPVFGKALSFSRSFPAPLSTYFSPIKVNKSLKTQKSSI